METYTAVGYKSFVAKAARPGTCLQKEKEKGKAPKARGREGRAGWGTATREFWGRPHRGTMATGGRDRGQHPWGGEDTGKVLERQGEPGEAVRAVSAEDQLASITDFI